MLSFRKIFNARSLFSSIEIRFLRHFYDWRSQSDTVFAPATSIEPKRGSPLAIIRVSGKRTSHVINELTGFVTDNQLSAQNNGTTGPPKRLLKPRYATLAKIRDPKVGELVDVGLLVWFPKPHSYTGEDTCELHVHGSQATMKRLMAVLGRFEGLRPAEAGEFTRRALANDKMTLIQAESLHELISSQTDQQRHLALRGLIGSDTEKKYNRWIEELVRILAHLEASIDFGEDELIGEQRVFDECVSKISSLACEIEHFIVIASQCRNLAQRGVRLAILGRPNAGKSTFMNKLCRQDKSIVSDLSGTTRDVIEHSFELCGHSVTVSDTAGLRDLSKLGQQHQQVAPPGQPSRKHDVQLEQHAAIEQEGIRRALDAARRSNVVLYLIDGAQMMTDCGFDMITSELTETLCLLQRDIGAEQSSCIESIHLVINKIDLCQDATNHNNDDDKDNHQHQDRSSCGKSAQDNEHGSAAGEERMRKLESLIKAMPLVGDKLVGVSQLSCKTGENFESIIEEIAISLAKLSSSQTSGTALKKARAQTGGAVAACDRGAVANSFERQPTESSNLDYVNERHLSLLRSTSGHLDRARQLDMRTIDEMAQHVRESVDYLSRIAGHVTNEQVIDVIFRDFCIGK